MADDKLPDPPRVQAVELLSRKPIVLGEAYADALRRNCGEVDVKVGEATIHAFHPDCPVGTTEDGKPIPAQTVVMHPGGEGVETEPYAAAVQQAWDWRDAGNVVAECGHHALLTDILAGGLTPKLRLHMLVRALKSALEVAEVDALHWKTSDRLVEPSAFLRALEQGQEFFCGPINARLFNIRDRAEGETVMDTLGMNLFRLPDVQLHFTGLDVNDVASFLYTTAKYLFDAGDVIEDGQTVQGLTDAHKWRCQHERSLVPPDRLVLDAHSGEFRPPS
ncbi:DUF4261 domain-containing protein [Planctomycetota bacterium]|nr:DUF4261 domain-containing protein [Planctomycetota bacterium]